MRDEGGDLAIARGDTHLLLVHVVSSQFHSRSQTKIYVNLRLQREPTAEPTRPRRGRGLVTDGRPQSLSACLSLFACRLRSWHDAHVGEVRMREVRMR